MAANPAALDRLGISAARAALLRVLQGCRSCARRASGEERRDRLRRLWQRFARRLLRLSFKRREWAFLGNHLRRIKERGKAD